MLPLGRRHQREPRTDPYRRRRAAGKKRRALWLRLMFWLRGNRRVARRPDAPDAAPPADTLPAEVSDRASAPPPAPPRRWLPTALRLLAAVALSMALGGAVYGVHYFLHHSPHFAIQQVRLSPTAHVKREVLLERAGIALGENLFRLDLGRVRRDLQRDQPWLKSVAVHRELPATVAIEVIEYQPRALLALDSLFLADEAGVAFKRATPAEARDLAVITGIGRDAYISDQKESQEQVREALLALSVYRAGAGRPAVGEVHVDPFAGITLYTEKGVELRLGQGGTAEWAARLDRFDAVWAALEPSQGRAAVVFLDNRAHPDHVTVRMEGAATDAPEPRSP